MTSTNLEEKEPISPEDIIPSLKLEPRYKEPTLRCSHDDEKYMPPEEVTRGVPWRPMLLAVFLTVVGTLLLGLSLLMLCGIIDDEDKTFWTVFFGGVITFIPGVYHVRLIYLAYHGTAGYSFDDIPSFD